MTARTTRRDRAPVRDHGPVHQQPQDPLDALDAANLRELAADARASYADVGAAVSLSAPAVKRRVDRLRERGVVRGFTVRLDPAALGWATEAFVELFCHGSTSPATSCCRFVHATCVTSSGSSSVWRPNRSSHAPGRRSCSQPFCVDPTSRAHQRTDALRAAH